MAARRKAARTCNANALERFHICWKQKPLWHFCVVAFSDGKPDSTPAFAGAGIFLKMLYSDRRLECGIDEIMPDAVKLKYVPARLAESQLEELIQVPLK